MVWVGRCAVCCEFKVDLATGSTSGLEDRASLASAPVGGTGVSLSVDWAVVEERSIGCLVVTCGEEETSV